MNLPFIWCKNLGGTFVRFVTIHACDGRTDRQTDGHLCDRKDRPAFMQRSKKTEENCQWFTCVCLRPIYISLCMLAACLYYVGKALEKDPTYVKGIAFKEKILTDSPYLQTLAIDFFQNWWVYTLTAGLWEEVVIPLWALFLLVYEKNFVEIASAKMTLDVIRWIPICMYCSFFSF